MSYEAHRLLADLAAAAESLARHVVAPVSALPLPRAPRDRTRASFDNARALELWLNEVRAGCDTR